MEVGGESEGEVREESAGSGGVEVLGGCTGDESPDKTDGDGGDEAEEETEHRDRDADPSGHGFHLQGHGLQYQSANRIEKPVLIFIYGELEGEQNRFLSLGLPNEMTDMPLGGLFTVCVGVSVSHDLDLVMKTARENAGWLSVGAEMTIVSLYGVLEVIESIYPRLAYSR